jgi:predicted O-methyltransferase YrrM
MRKLVAAFFGSALGRRFLGVVAAERPDLLAGALGYTLSQQARLSRVGAWPAKLESFADVAPLVLSSNPANRGVASMRLDEVAYLWRLAAGAGDATLIEIGRERGGSTLVLAAAMSAGAALYSFDPQSKHPGVGAKFDDELRDALARYGLLERVRLSREDSHAAQPPPGEYALVLVDGDPSLAGTRSDFERFCRRLRPGGHALFHDAAAGGPRHETLKPLIAEIERDGHFERRPDVGTFVDFTRRASARAREARANR